MDLEIRTRLRKWLQHYKDKRHWTNERLAKELGVAEPTLTNALNGKSIGLDFFVKMHRGLHKSADDLLADDPPKDPDSP